MQRIEDPSAAASLPGLPTFPAGSVTGYFQEQNASTGTPATLVRGYWLNAVQEELIAIIIAAGLTPSGSNLAQVLAALDVLFNARLGYTPVQQGTGVDQLENALKLGWDGANVRATVDVGDLGPLALASWVSANYQPLGSYQPAGEYQPGMMKSGIATVAPSNATVLGASVTFPTPFPGGCTLAIAIPAIPANSTYGYRPTARFVSSSQYVANFEFDTLTGVGSTTAVTFNQTFYFSWAAWGY